VHKLNSGRVPLPENGPRRQWECLLYAIKGNKQVTHIYPDVIPCQGDENLGFGAQKPVELFQNLLQRSVKPGDKVLDLFMGTGPIIPAAHNLQCEATGIEKDLNRYGIALGRVKQLAIVEKGGSLL
jgi:DNA modification methylase